MQYRSFGKLNWKPSALGFGAMRLPTIGQNSAKIDLDQATRMLHYAIEHGVNYVDTAYTYHEEMGEIFIGNALKGERRKKVRLATKMPCWLVKEKEDFDRYFNTQLERLQTEIDFYLLHSLNQYEWSRMKELHVIEWGEKKMREGRFPYFGFSYHGPFSVFKEIVDFYNFDFCYIQYNFMDEDYQAGREGLLYAAAKGMAVVAMEPIRGGLLSPRILPTEIENLWEKAPISRSPAEWALQWVWNQPEISLALSGMSTFRQVEENIASAERSGIDILSDEELALIAQVREQYRKLSPLSCTGCRYCQPCPQGVKIAAIFELYMDAVMYNYKDRSITVYTDWIAPENRADRCLECGQCEERCPQGIQISSWLKKIHSFLTQTD